MNSDLSPLITRLARGEILRIDNAKGQSIAIVSGMVWVTQEGDRRDSFLSDGESFAFDRPGVALVQAMSDTRLIALVNDTAEVIETAAARRADRVGGYRGRTTGAAPHWEPAADPQPAQ